MENRIKRKLVCTGWLLDISTSTTIARKKLLIDFRGRICSGKGGCKCGNCRVRKLCEWPLFRCRLQDKRRMWWAWTDGEHQDVILGQRHRSILDLFFRIWPCIYRLFCDKETSDIRGQSDTFYDRQEGEKWWWRRREFRCADVQGSGSTSVSDSIVESEMSSSTVQGVTVSISYHCLRHIIHDYLAKFRGEYPRRERPQKTYNRLFTFCIYSHPYIINMYK